MKSLVAKLVLCMLTLATAGALFTPAAADNEPNNEFTAAEMIGAGLFNGMVDTADPKDFYGFDMPGGSEWELAASIVSGEEAKFTVYDFAKVPIDASQALGASDQWVKIYRCGQVVSRYFISVERADPGATGPCDYRFTLLIGNQTDAGFPGDAGDDLNGAVNVSGILQFNGTVGDADMADHYSLPCSIGDNLSIELSVTSGNGSGRMRLFKPDQTVMAESEQAGVGKKETITRTVPAAGKHYFEVYSSSDHRGAGYDYDIKITSTPMPPEDKTAPLVDITSPFDGTTLNRTAVVVAGTASDEREVVLVEVSVNDGPALPAGGTEDWSVAVVLSVGQNTITALAKDSSDNVGSASISVNVTGTGTSDDTVLPTVAFVSPAEGEALVQPAATIRGTAGDDRGVLRVEVKANEGPWTVANGTVDWNVPVLLRLGKNTVQARAVDTSGNTASRMARLFLTREPKEEHLLPVIHILDPGDRAVVQNPALPVRGDANDDKGVLKVDLSLNGGPWRLAEEGPLGWVQWTANITLADGPNNLSARAMDLSGNTQVHSISVYYSGSSADTQPPVVVIRVPAPTGATVNVPAFLVMGTASDNVGVLMVDLSVNGGPWLPANGTTAWSREVQLVPGNNMIRARATDRAANTNTTEVSVILNTSADLVRPVVVILSPNNNTGFASDRIVIRGSATDNQGVVRVEVKVNGVPVAVTGLAAWQAKITLTQAKSRIDVTAIDASGNQGTQTIWVNYNKATPKPPIPGFEGLYLAAAVGLVAALIARRGRA